MVLCTVYSDADLCAQRSGFNLDVGILISMKKLLYQCCVTIIVSSLVVNKELISL